MIKNSPPLHVVVGIVLHSDRDHVLIAQRPKGKSSAGKWEFPGGKKMQHENPREALQRELFEELGIKIKQAHPWLQYQTIGAVGEILLDVWLIDEFSDQPYGKENQAIVWVKWQELMQYDLLSANQVIVKKLLEQFAIN